MGKRAILEFFNPTPIIIIIFGLFLSVAIVSDLRWNIFDRGIIGIIGLIWIYFTFPLLMISWATIPGFLDPPLLQILTPLGATVGIIYYYLLSCLIVHTFRSIKWDNESWRRAQGINS